MKLFLASYRFGAHASEFTTLTGGPGRVAVIANAADCWPAAARESAVLSEMRGLRELGYEPEELDLRQYDGRPDALATRLDAVSTVWIRGGNTFVLRSQLRFGKADEALVSRVRDGSLVYAGYSAGACIASPSLRGVETADDPSDVTEHDLVWDGLGLVDLAFVPHFGSVLDDTDAGTSMVDRFERERVPYLTLTDEQVFVVDGVRAERL